MDHKERTMTARIGELPTLVERPPLQGTDLLVKVPFLKALVRSRSFQFLLILPNMVVFYALILAGIFGHPLGRSPAAQTGSGLVGSATSGCRTSDSWDWRRSARCS
jgi:hypothetical protein